MKKIKWFQDELIFNYDVVDFGKMWGEPDKNNDTNESKELLLESIMKKCGITTKDLEDISIVKSKLRDANIDDILK